MSTRFTIYCESCDEIGPHIRRHHSGALLQEEDVPRFFGISDKDEASRDWGGFLIEHEFCDLRLRRELAQQLARQKREQERIAALPKPTHEMLEDGSLREL